MGQAISADELGSPRTTVAEQQKVANEAAFRAVSATLKSVAGVAPSSLEGGQRRLAQRFQKRLELRMILMAQKELELITPAQYQSIDTGDLKDQEIRALLYKLVVQHPNLISTSADAQRLVTTLEKLLLLGARASVLEAAASADPEELSLELGDSGDDAPDPDPPDDKMHI